MQETPISIWAAAGCAAAKMGPIGADPNNKSRGKNYGIGKIAKRTGRVPESRSEEQVAGNGVSRKRRQIAGYHHLV